MSDYQQVIATLRMSYNREKAEQRNQAEKNPGKLLSANNSFLSFNRRIKLRC